MWLGGLGRGSRCDSARCPLSRCNRALACGVPSLSALRLSAFSTVGGPSVRSPDWRPPLRAQHGEKLAALEAAGGVEAGEDGKGKVGDCRREKSLGLLSQKFVQLFLVSVTRVVSLGAGIAPIARPCTLKDLNALR